MISQMIAVISQMIAVISQMIVVISQMIVDSIHMNNMEVMIGSI